MILEYLFKIGNVIGIKYLVFGWDKGFEKLFLFMKVEKKNFGKKKVIMEYRLVFVSLKYVVIFFEDEYKKYEEFGTIVVVFCIILGNVMDVICICVVGKVGYCNYIWVFMLKICKYFLFESKII